MSSMSLSTTLMLSLTVVLLAAAATGQSIYGDISGTLTSTSGEPIVAAKITVTSLEKGGRSYAKTNDSGNYSVTDLPPDTYDISVEANGFKTFKETGIPVFADQTSRINIQLSEGLASDVVAAIPRAVSILKTDRTDVSTTFDTKALIDLPVRDLNFTQFELLVPGALPIFASLKLNQNPQGGVPVNVNGQLFSGTVVQLDGTDNRDPLQGLIVINPTLESVSGMKFTTQNYGAEFGQATAGVVSIQTRSGTNSWHGSAFDFRRTDWGQATDPFSQTPLAPIKRNEFGASFGGPLIRNRVFFFGDYQGTRQSTTVNQLLSVPTVKVRSTCLGPTFAGGPCDLSEYASSAIYDPKNHQNKFSGNLIPNSEISQAAVNLLQLLPLPNHQTTAPGIGNFQTSVTEIFDADQFNTRVDYNASGKLKLLARYSFADFRDDGSTAFGQTAGGMGTNPPTPSPQGFAGVGQTRNQELSSGFVYNLSPTLVTDGRFGFFRYHLNLDSLDLGTMPAETIALTPGLNGGDIFSSGMPDIELLPPGPSIQFGYSPRINNCNCPLREKEQQFQWVSNWNNIVGNHVLRWGADIRYLQNFRLASDTRRAGRLVFDSITTNSTGGPGAKNGLGLATFLLGTVTSFDQFYSNPANPVAFDAGEREKRWFFYGQDTWRVTQHLTVNFGLRWELYFPQSVTASDAGGFLVPDFRSPPNSMFNVPGVAGVGRNGNVKNSLGNLGPRLGMAYLVRPKTVLRAGYGRSFDVGFAGSVFGISATQNPPVMISLLGTNTGHPFAFQLENTVPTITFPVAPFSLATLNAALSAGNPNSQAIVYAVPGKIRLPTVDAWNVALQHQVSSSMYFEVAYVGNKGTHVLTDSVDESFYDINEPSLQNFVIPSSGRAAECDTNTNPNFHMGTYCVSKASTRQLFNPWTGPVRYFGNSASNNYNSLQAKLEKYFGGGYGFLAHYTWAKALNYASQYFNVNPKIGYGPSTFDRRHAFVLTNMWDLPVGKGKALLGNSSTALDRLVGGWSINAITTWYSGLPFTPSYMNCAVDQVNSRAPCRPNLVGGVQITGNRQGWFTTTGGTALQFGSGGFDPNTGVTSPGMAMGPWQRPAPEWLVMWDAIPFEARVFSKVT